MVSVLFVCHANICRSPMAEALFRRKVAQLHLTEKIVVDSAGISDVRSGQQTHPSVLQLLKSHGISNYIHHARTIHFDDYYTFNYMLASDETVLKRLKSAQPMDSIAQLGLILSYDKNAPTQEIEDPCATGRFEIVYSLIDSSTTALLNYIQHTLD